MLQNNFIHFPPSGLLSKLQSLIIRQRCCQVVRTSEFKWEDFAIWSQQICSKSMKKCFWFHSLFPKCPRTISLIISQVDSRANPKLYNHIIILQCWQVITDSDKKYFKSVQYSFNYIHCSQSVREHFHSFSGKWSRGFSAGQSRGFLVSLENLIIRLSYQQMIWISVYHIRKLSELSEYQTVISANYQNIRVSYQQIIK